MFAGLQWWFCRKLMTFMPPAPSDLLGQYELHHFMDELLSFPMSSSVEWLSEWKFRSGLPAQQKHAGAPESSRFYHRCSEKQSAWQQMVQTPVDIVETGTPELSWVDGCVNSSDKIMGLPNCPPQWFDANKLASCANYCVRTVHLLYHNEFHYNTLFGNVQIYNALWLIQHSLSVNIEKGGSFELL